VDDQLLNPDSVVGAGIVRTYWLARISTDPLRDITWVGFETLVWSVLEMQLAIICASAPALKVFIGKYLVDPMTKGSNYTSFHVKSQRIRSFGWFKDSKTHGVSSTASASYPAGEATEARWSGFTGIQKSFLLSIRWSEAPCDFCYEEQETHVYAEKAPRYPDKTHVYGAGKPLPSEKDKPYMFVEERPIPPEKDWR